MPKIALINMLIGFSALVLAAAAGAFLSMDLTKNYALDPASIHHWNMLLTKSSHGHFNLFGILHIVFGLTLPYSQWPLRWKQIQTIGLAAGLVAMGPCMLYKASQAPNLSIQGTDVLIGFLLSASLVALFAHAVGIASKIWRA